MSSPPLAVTLSDGGGGFGAMGCRDEAFLLGLGAPLLGPGAVGMPLLGPGVGVKVEGTGGFSSSVRSITSLVTLGGTSVALT